MQFLLKSLGMSFVSVGVLMFVGTVYAADAGGALSSGRGRAGLAQAKRMPTMPTTTVNTSINMSPNLPSDNGWGYVPPAPSDPNPPSRPDKPDHPHHPDHPDKPDEPTPEPECPDGGVKDSEYTVNSCMNDIYACVNNGGLPNGINDMFNEDLRNSIENGMALCIVQVEKCLTDVRRNCERVYRSAADVWIDFNTRKVQPEYYNFVLRKTGLTPLQAENTCLLLDRNTYGSSFNAVANNGKTTVEYNARTGAFNGQQNNSLSKNNPLGVAVNTGHKGVDGQRGHYARWDAANADCYIRVGAYNKDTLIKNSWLFGAVGDDRPAEVWKLAGESFVCNKDLFGFSLMKNTNTAAVVGIGGGTLLGAGIGAAAGHGAREFSCQDEDMRKKLSEQLVQSGQIAILNEYLSVPLYATDALTIIDCNDILDLYQTYVQALNVAGTCTGGGGMTTVREELYANIQCTKKNGSTTLTKEDLNECFRQKDETKPCVGQEFTSTDQCAEYLLNNSHLVNTTIVTAANQVETSGNCMFKHINIAARDGGALYCGAGSECITAAQLRRVAEKLGSVFASLSVLQGEKNNRLKTTLTGAGIGAAAGGIATGITAIVENHNINCRLGDGLAQIGNGKSYNIETLRDFYVKWGLKLPDSIMPTGQANDCNSWRALCGALSDANQCKNAQINYRGPEDKTLILIQSACRMSGSRCIENYSVAKSYGACE